MRKLLEVAIIFAVLISSACAPSYTSKMCGTLTQKVVSSKGNSVLVDGVYKVNIPRSESFSTLKIGKEYTLFFRDQSATKLLYMKPGNKCTKPM